MDTADLLTVNLRRRVPDAQLLAKPWVKRLQKRLIGIRDDCNRGALVTDGLVLPIKTY